VEIGSGYSSALVCDTENEYFKGELHKAFVEPYPENRLAKMVREDNKTKIYPDRVQNVGLNPFLELN